MELGQTRRMIWEENKQMKPPIYDQSFKLKPKFFPLRLYYDFQTTHNILIPRELRLESIFHFGNVKS